MECHQCPSQHFQVIITQIRIFLIIHISFTPLWQLGETILRQGGQLLVLAPGDQVPEPLAPHIGLDNVVIHILAASPQPAANLLLSEQEFDVSWEEVFENWAAGTPELEDTGALRFICLLEARPGDVVLNRSDWQVMMPPRMSTAVLPGTGSAMAAPSLFFYCTAGLSSFWKLLKEIKLCTEVINSKLIHITDRCFYVFISDRSSSHSIKH